MKRLSEKQNHHKGKGETMNIIKTTDTHHENGRVKTRTILHIWDGKLYETIRFYSTSGVYFNFFDRPVN